MEIRPHPKNDKYRSFGSLLQRAIITYEDADERGRLAWLAPRFTSRERHYALIDSPGIITIATSTDEELCSRETTVTHRTLGIMASKLIMRPRVFLDNNSDEQAQEALETITTYFGRWEQETEL